MPTTTALTADDLLRVRDGKHHELIDGELIPVPSGAELGQIVANVTMTIAPLVRDRELGHIVGSGAGFQCYPGDPNRVRRPHVAFVSYDRWPRNVRVPGHCPFAPELAVLVISETCRWSDIATKVQDYLGVNVIQVWVVNENLRQVFVYSKGKSALLQERDELTCDEILPGFRCRVSDFFEGIPRED